MTGVIFTYFYNSALCDLGPWPIEHKTNMGHVLSKLKLIKGQHIVLSLFVNVLTLYKTADSLLKCYRQEFILVLSDLFDLALTFPH